MLWAFPATITELLMPPAPPLVIELVLPDRMAHVFTGFPVDCELMVFEAPPPMKVP